MGEVYRARDPRLSREVAVKTLPASFSQDAARLQRFEKEALAASALNHPNIVVVHDIGTSSDGIAYIAMELVEGPSLRLLLASGPLPEKKVLEVAAQIADALAKAHSAGIVHRDLKPENVMISTDGFVKLLDFGLAKAVASPEVGSSALPTAIGRDTEPGTLLGTVGYMSPEQASGRPVDFRSDQFSLGTILYEMATGQPAFQRKTNAETLTAIIREEPEPIARLNPRAPAPYRWIVERCLTKDPEERYASTRDLARELKSVRDHISEASPSGPAPAAIGRRWRSVAAWTLVAAIALGLAGMAATFYAGRRTARMDPPSFQQLTFRRGAIQAARFAPDGQTVVYSAAWDGAPIEVFQCRLDGPESRPFGLEGAGMLSISRTGEMAVALNAVRRGISGWSGTLAQIPLAGGAAPREILEAVDWADWAPDGKSLAVVVQHAGRYRIAYPVGTTVYETSGWVSHLRVSPDGSLVAFIDHPSPGDDAGAIAVVDRSGTVRRLSPEFASAQGLAWSADERLWFTAAPVGAHRALYVTTLAGKASLRVRVPDSLILQDISREGRMLVGRETRRVELFGVAPGESEEKRLGWLDHTVFAAITADGRAVLFDEQGAGGGAGYSVYIRETDGSPAVRLGEGAAQDLSPDGQWALAILQSTTHPRLVAYPTRSGEMQDFKTGNLRVFQAGWLPSGKGVLMIAAEPGRGARLFRQDSAGAKARALSPEGFSLPNHPITSPDGNWTVTLGPDRKYYLYPLDGAEPVAVPGLTEGDVIAQRSADGRSLYVHRVEVPMRVYRLDLSTGKKELWRTLMPPDAAGVVNIGAIPAPDGRSLVYGHVQLLSDLYLVEGVN
jgi:Tol biopolymer transport system component